MTFQHLLKDDFIFNYVSEFMEFNNIKLSIINVGGKYYFNQYDNMFLIKDDIFKTKRGKNKLFRDELKYIFYGSLLFTMIKDIDHPFELMKIKKKFFGYKLDPFIRGNIYQLTTDASTHEHKPVWEFYCQLKEIYDYEKSQ